MSNTDSDNQIDLITAQNKKYTLKDLSRKYHPNKVKVKDVKVLLSRINIPESFLPSNQHAKVKMAPKLILSKLRIPKEFLNFNSQSKKRSTRRAYKKS